MTHSAENDAPRRGWRGVRCKHETCAPYGICLVGPPLPTPPPPRVIPPEGTKADYLLDGSPEAVAIVREARGLTRVTPPGVSRGSNEWLSDAIADLYHPEFGTEWRGPDGSLFVVLREAQAAAWEAGYRHGRGKVDQAQIDLHNPYRREASP